MCKNEESWNQAMKREFRSRSYTHENQELRSLSHVSEKKSSGAGAVSFYDGSAALEKTDLSQDTGHWSTDVVTVKQMPASATCHVHFTDTRKPLRRRQKLTFRAHAEIDGGLFKKRSKVWFRELRMKISYKHFLTLKTAPNLLLQVKLTLTQ